MKLRNGEGGRDYIHHSKILLKRIKIKKQIEIIWKTIEKIKKLKMKK